MNIALEKRIDLEREVGNEEWALSLLFISEGLTKELEERLKEEERYLGMAKSYVNSMWDAFEDVNDEVDDETWNIFCRETYLLKPVILREYRFLSSRRLSPGDCIIVILKKIYELLTEMVEGENVKDFKYSRQLGTLSKLIGKFFENIRNKKKNSKLFNLTNSIKECIGARALGKYTLERIKIETSTLPNGTPQVVPVLEDPGDRLGNEGEAITEISWNDEL